MRYIWAHRRMNSILLKILLHVVSSCSNLYKCTLSLSLVFQIYVFGLIIYNSVNAMTFSVMALCHVPRFINKQQRR